MHLSIKLASPYTDKENGIQGEGRGGETKKTHKKTQKTPFIAHPTLAQPICKRQVTLQLAILQTKQMNEALQVAQKERAMSSNTLSIPTSNISRISTRVVLS